MNSTPILASPAMRAAQCVQDLDAIHEEIQALASERPCLGVQRFADLIGRTRTYVGELATFASDSPTIEEQDVSATLAERAVAGARRDLEEAKRFGLSTMSPPRCSS